MTHRRAYPHTLSAPCFAGLLSPVVGCIFVGCIVGCGVDNRTVDVDSTSALGPQTSGGAVPGASGSGGTGSATFATMMAANAGGAPSAVPPAMSAVAPAPPVASGGAAGNGAAGSGQLNAAGSGQSSAAGSGPGAGFALLPVDGWVSGATNEVGIQGSFYTLSDAAGVPAGDTSIVPQDFTSSGSRICVAGSASQVLNEAYGQYWGGGVALAVGDPGDAMPLRAWNRGRVVGFRYTITGPTIPPSSSFRFSVTFDDGGQPYAGSQYCQPLTAVSGVPITTTLASPELIQSCWQPGGPQLPTSAELRSLEWLVTTNTTAPIPFDFCIENLTAIVAP